MILKAFCSTLNSRIGGLENWRIRFLMCSVGQKHVENLCFLTCSRHQTLQIYFLDQWKNVFLSPFNNKNKDLENWNSNIWRVQCREQVIYWYLICKTRYSKTVKKKICRFLWRIWKWKEKKLTFPSGDLNPRFSVVFPPMIWIFMRSEEPEIKSKQGPKRDR